MEHANAPTAMPSLTHWHEQTLRFAGVGMCRCTLDGMIVYADAKAQEILCARHAGKPPASLRGERFDTFASQGFSPAPAFDILARSMEVRNLEVCRTGYSGLTHWIRFDAFTEKDPATGAPMVQILVQDITHQRETEEALRAGERRFRLLAENIPGVIFLCRNDARFTMVFLNHLIEAITGYPQELFLTGRMSITDLFHPDDTAEIRDRVATALQEHAPFHLVHRLRRRPGEWRWVEVHGAGVFEERTGELLFLEGVLHDVNDRHDAQAALEESEAHHRFLAQNSMDLIVRMDTDGRFLYLSPASATLLGLDPGEMVNRPVCEFIHPDEVETLRAFHGRMKENPGRYTVEHRLRRADGSYMWVETNLHMMLNDATGTEEIIAIIRDVTEQRRLREEVQRHAESLEAIVDHRTAQLRELEAQRAEMEKLAATGRMAAGVAHEINNPLTGIRNCLLLLGKNVPETHPDRQFVDLAQREIERITRIVRQMSQLYRPETDTASRIQLGSEMRDICLMLEPKFAQKRLTVRVSAAEDLPDALVPAGHMRQILYNLVVNAAEASPEDGIITFRAAPAGERIEIQVVDEGDGIAEDILPRIFEPFFTTKGPGDGSCMGLGLSVSRSLAHAMNAELLVKTARGAGTVFSLVLPVTATIPRTERTAP